MSRIKLKQISDVSLSNVQDGDVLQYNSSTNKFENGVVSGGGGGGGSSSSLVFHADVVNNNTTLVLADAETFVSVKNGSTAFNVYLPLISGKNTYKVHIKRLGTAYVTVNVNSADTGKFIDFSGTTSFVLAVTGTALTLVANEADGAWYIV